MSNLAARNAGNSHLVRYFLPLLPTNRNANVLDFGSGRGHEIDFFHANGYTGLVGFERDESLKQYYSKPALAVTTFGSDGSRFLRESGKKWDAVIIRDVLYYFEDAGALEFLQELKRSMEPGGVLLVEIFNGACLTAPYVQSKDRGIRRIFTEHSISHLLRAAGFEVESVSGIRPEIRGPHSLAFFFGSRLWQLLLRGIYWAERGIDPQNPGCLEKKLFIHARVR